MKRYLSLISFDRAIEILNSTFRDPHRTETVPVTESFGRVIARPVYAGYSVPGENLSAMDGYAVRCRDTVGAKEQNPVIIKDFVQVNTGNIVPPGYDAVVMVEDTWDAADGILIRKPAMQWQHIRSAGEDVKEGELILPAGHQVRHFDIGALVTYGITHLEVMAVHIGLIPTGSEIIPLGQKKVAVERTPYSLFRELPERRLEIRFGKFSLADFFDLNVYGTDTNFQFMNWTVDNNGAYDYAADTRGFTYAALVEFHDRNYVIRFAEALMPKVANGVNLDADLARARAENIEFEIHGRVIGQQQGILRLLSYVNHANMGVYRQQVDEWLADASTTVPEITNHPLQTTVKYGFGVNFEQPFNDWIGIFGRWGWNEGQHESYAYTEADQTWQIGVGGVGTRWERKWDRMGAVFVTNGINHEHARYLGYGGLGFLLGDGKLNYGREYIIETYYTVHLWRGIYPAAGLQYAWNPGYNRDRGPVIVPTLRLHLEF